MEGHLMTGPNRLDDVFGRQADFQRHINTHPEDIVEPQELIDYIIYMKTALDQELAEMLQEIGWKPWATSRHINVEGVKSELVDTFQFFMNLCFAVGLSATELIDRHQNKLKVNYERADNSYDGKSTKCAWCGRALDDTYVDCITAEMAESVSVPAAELIGYCVTKAESWTTGWFTQEDLEKRHERQA
jgi:hypothetical protein